MNFKKMSLSDNSEYPKLFKRSSHISAGMSRKETYINSYVPKVVILKSEIEISFGLLYTRKYSR